MSQDASPRTKKQDTKLVIQSLHNMISNCTMFNLTKIKSFSLRNIQKETNTQIEKKVQHSLVKWSDLQIDVDLQLFDSPELVYFHSSQLQKKDQHSSPLLRSQVVATTKGNGQPTAAQTNKSKRPHFMEHHVQVSHILASFS